MKTTEIIEKVKQNLKIQEELKEQLENDESKSEIIEEKIAYAQEKLLVAEQDEEVLKETLIKDLENSINDLRSNLTLQENFAYPDANMYGYGISFDFMGKDYQLLDIDYDLTSNEEVKDVALFANKLFEDFIAKGKVIFNEGSLKKLKEIKRIYDVKPEVITEKLVSMDMDRKVKKLQRKLFAKKEQLDEKVTELKEVEEKIEKTKEFKSEFLKKIFNKKAKLTEKRTEILQSNEKLNKEVKVLESKLAAKATMKEESIEYVKSELNALNDVFAWVDSFDSSKLKLVKYKEKYIVTLQQEIQDLEEDKANTQTKIKEIKGMLQLNKKVNNEIVINALMNNGFVESFKSIDSAQVAKEDVAAVKFIENKYDDYLQNCIEKAVK